MNYRGLLLHTCCCIVFICLNSNLCLNSSFVSSFEMAKRIYFPSLLLPCFWPNQPRSPVLFFSRGPTRRFSSQPTSGPAPTLQWPVAAHPPPSSCVSPTGGTRRSSPTSGARAEPHPGSAPAARPRARAPLPSLGPRVQAAPLVYLAAAAAPP
jgi:hypothetical protein